MFLDLPRFGRNVCFLPSVGGNLAYSWFARSNLLRSQHPAALTYVPNAAIVFSAIFNCVVVMGPYLARTILRP